MSRVLLLQRISKYQLARASTAFFDGSVFIALHSPCYSPLFLTPGLRYLPPCTPRPIPNLKKRRRNLACWPIGTTTAFSSKSLRNPWGTVRHYFSRSSSVSGVRSKRRKRTMREIEVFSGLLLGTGIQMETPVAKSEVLPKRAWGPRRERFCSEGAAEGSGWAISRRSLSRSRSMRAPWPRVRGEKYDKNSEGCGLLWGGVALVPCGEIKAVRWREQGRSCIAVAVGMFDASAENLCTSESQV